ncbi:MAG: hypothetical protein J2P43_13375 [Candidatus Dormibacteraeota bacterium]|nr:hypothetical protein [Candidatus Dormibacteraeota bacterium]
MLPRGEAKAVSSLAELEALVESDRPLFIRYAQDPGLDSRQRSVDAESGLELPGLSVNPLTPESWWTRPVAEWLARQICQYGHLRERDPGRHAWVLGGTIAGRGPDCEPLITNARLVARLDDAVLDEADALYRDRFSAGRPSSD